MKRYTSRRHITLGTVIVAVCAAALTVGSCAPAQDAVNSLDALAGSGAKLQPAIESITPDTVIADGGTNVKIRGSSFTKDTLILFGGRPPRSLDFVDSETINAVTPALPPGTTEVVARHSDGGAPSSPAQITVRLGVSPPTGPVTGGTTITVFNPQSRNTISSDDQVLFAVLRPDVDPTDNHFDFDANVVQVDVAQSTNPINNSLLTAVTPPHAEGETVVFIASNQGSVFFVGIFHYETAVPMDGGPRLVSAISTSNTTVLVTLSEAVVGVPGHGNAPPTGALSPAKYMIAQKNENPESGMLLVSGVTFSGPDHMSIVLTTGQQSEVMYELSVTGIKDLAGNILAPPELLVDPTRTHFVGTPLSCVHGVCSDGGAACSIDANCNSGSICESIDSAATPHVCSDSASACAMDNDCTGALCLPVCDGVDADGDGLTDAAEQRGWTVTVQLVNGDITTRTVTSNPFISDTDGDGVLDSVEKSFGMDPRARDTDADQISDFDELNAWFSDPCDQDTDDDTFTDWLDAIFFKTSPIMADSDGDQISDADEVLRRNRNPLVADLPLPQITVDNIRLDLKIISSYTDEQGETHSVSDTRTTSFSQSRAKSIGRSDTNSTQTENQSSQKFGGEYSFPGGKVFAEFGFQQSSARGFSSTVDSKTSEASQSEYQKSVTKALEQSERRAVTRTIEEAIVQATVNIANQSDLAFTVTNIELSLLQQDRSTGLSFRPIAVLRPAGAFDPTSQPSFNLGPFDIERGPIIFENVEVFPNLIDDLMREPTGLVFKFANYDVLDEFGRNLVFSSQEANDCTVGLTVDFGDGVVESYRIATTSRFDPETRRAKGISMQRALEIVGCARAEGDDTPLPEGPPGPAIRNTYGTIVADDGIEHLTRIRDVQNDLSHADPQKRAWFAILSNPDLDPETDFSAIMLHAQETVLLMYTRDIDDDGLFEREEHLYGSDDSNTDTDADQLGDFQEVREGWIVYRLPGLPYKVFPSPVRADSDLDGLSDYDEYVGADGLPPDPDAVSAPSDATDPNRADTDEDGLSDASEIGDTFTIFLFDGDLDPRNNPTLIVEPYSDWTIIAGPDGVCDTISTLGDDEAVASTAAGAAICVTAGGNGIIDTTPANDDQLVATMRIAPGPNGECDTDALVGSDDVIEFDQATRNPAIRGSVGAVCISAGLNGTLETDPAADDFVRVAHKGLFATDPLNRDTDADGIPDGREVLWTKTNPNTNDAGSVIDSDGDGLFDDEEEKGWDVTVTDSDGSTSTYSVKSNKFLPDSDRDGIPDVYERAISTDPLTNDTDGDELLDGEEFDPNDVRYDVYAMAEADRRCADAPNCKYLPPDEEPFGTDPTLADTDGDGLNDNEELFPDPPIQILVNGEPRALPDLCDSYSDPTKADTDGDGLDDLDERDRNTDPCNEDTDGDDVNDGIEVDPRRGTNPLISDKYARFRFIRINCSGCDDGSNDDCLELYGTWYIKKNGESEVQVEHLPYWSDNDDYEDYGQVLCNGRDRSLRNQTFDYILREQDSVRVYVSGVGDYDEWSANDQFGNAEKAYGYASITTQLGETLSQIGESSSGTLVTYFDVIVITGIPD